MGCFVFVHACEIVYVDCDVFPDEGSAVLAAFKRATVMCDVSDFETVEIWYNSDHLVSLSF